MLVAKWFIENSGYMIRNQKRRKDLLLKTSMSLKTMEQVGSIQEEVGFIGKVSYFFLVGRKV